MRRVLLLLVLCVVAALPSCGGSWRRFAYEGFGRDGWQQPDRVVEVLALRGGARVADLGAGGGYFTFRLADAVGDGGRVYAIDVDPDMIEYLQGRVRDDGYANVEVIAGEYDDPLIPAAGADLVFTANTYHHIEGRTAYFDNVRNYLRPGGRVAIIELNGDSWFRRRFGHYTPASEIQAEMEAAGYLLAADHDFLERQSFLVFAPATQPESGSESGS